MAQSENTKIPIDRNSIPLMRRLWDESVQHHKKRLLVAALLMAVVAGATAMTAWLIDPVINELFVKKDDTMLGLIALGVFMTFMIRSLATYAQDLLITFVGQRIVADTQTRLFRHLLRQDVETLQADHSATLLSRFTFDINMMRYAVSDAVVVIGRDSLTIVFLVGLMFYQEWLLASIALVVAPLSSYPIQLLGKKVRSITRQTQEEMGELTTQLAQSFQGIRTVKSFRMEGQEESRANRLVERLFDLNYRMAKARSATQPATDLFAGIAIAAVILYGGTRVMSGETTAGAFFSFMTALMLAYQPLRVLGRMSARIQEGLAAADRVFKLMDQRASIVDKPDAVSVPREAGSVRFDGVSLRYGKGDGQALSGVIFDAPAGKTTALVGPSGAGKSSVLNLIPRFYDVAGGAVSVNGHDVRDVTLDSLRDAIALVSQEVVLFDDTIASNIRYGRWGASESEIHAAAKAAAAADFIEALSLDYNTVVGEQGLRLSGGQRQRIAIARALLKDAPILLLDEATSALDTESERQIQQALATLMQGRTTIVIAHRLSTVINAEMIHVMDHGRVTQSGNHQDLLDQGGLYAKLHALQFDAPKSSVKPLSSKYR